METVRIAPELLADRLDARYNSKAAVALRQLLKDCHLNAAPMSEVFTKVSCGPFGSTLTEDEFSADGDVLVVQPTNISGDFFSTDSAWRISRAVLESKGLPLYSPGTFVFARVGVYPHVGVIPTGVGDCTISSKIIAATCGGNRDPHYLFAFFRGKHGAPLLFAAQKSTAQPTIGTYEILQTVVPVPDTRVQRYIGDKIRQSYQLASFSRVLENAVGMKFMNLIEGVRDCPRGWRTKSNLLDTFRMNPSHYDPTALKMIQDAEQKVELIELGSLLGERAMSGGATPLGADYGDSGVFFVRVQNVKPYRLDLSDAAYLSSAQDAQLARSRCRANDIIFSITGYPGTASLVMDDDLPININQHCVRLDIKPPSDAAYVVAAMNSPFVKRQVDRLAIGGTREALDYPSVRSLLIPMLDQPTMDEISQKVRTLNSAARLSQRLIVAAKCMAEALVEGKIPESEFIVIQNEIDGGNYGPDRELLARLTPDGADVSDSPKLFPDLPSLYSVLRDAVPAEAE